MQRLNKDKLIYILLISIFLMGIYYLFFKDESYKENNSYSDFLNLNDENIKKNNNLLDTESKITIYITGQVKNQGVYELKENSRIDDIIKLAGGLTDEANIDNLNLAFMLEDGMKIYIPRNGEEDIEINDSTDKDVFDENNTTDKIINSKSSTKSQKININTAKQKELENLPGIGTSTALKIIKYRTENGKFNNIEDIKKVNGIGESKFLKIKDLIKV